MRRGRPKYDDVLTPREWEVLELLRQGLTNEEIAAQLGISVNGAKYHVSEIISKLGVSSRREAAARPVVSRAHRYSAAALVLRFGLLRLAGAAVLLLATAGLIALAVGVAVSRDSNGSSAVAGPPSPTPLPEEATPTPTLTASRERLAGLFATSTALAARPTFTPTPVYAPTGRPIPVWVYADADPSGNCFDLIEQMIPATAPDETPGKAVECSLQQDYRVTLTQRADGYYHLDFIMLLVLLRADFPDLPPGPGMHDCMDVRDLILLSTEAPKAATYVGVCAYVPPYRGEEGREESLVWTSVENPLAPEDLPSDTPCEVTTLYLGAPRDSNLDLRDVTCLLR